LCEFLFFRCGVDDLYVLIRRHHLPEKARYLGWGSVRR